jgi:hypothetical protein
VGPNDVRRWSLSLSRAVPLDLRVHAGVGRNTLDLRAATLSGLTYAAGVGETTVTLPERGGYDASFDLGVGATTVRVPDGVEARVTVRSGLGRVTVSGTFRAAGRRLHDAGVRLGGARRPHRPDGAGRRGGGDRPAGALTSLAER